MPRTLRRRLAALLAGPFAAQHDPRTVSGAQGRPSASARPLPLFVSPELFGFVRRVVARELLRICRACSYVCRRGGYAEQRMQEQSDFNQRLELERPRPSADATEEELP